jgi:hypothetical protein
MAAFIWRSILRMGCSVWYVLIVDPRGALATPQWTVQ